MAESGLDYVKIGEVFRFAKTVGEVDVTLFAGLTGDFSDTHINEQYMNERSSLGTRIAHGALIVGYMSTVSTVSIAHIIHKPGLTDFPVSSGYDRIRFLRPTFLGDTVTVTYEIESIDREVGKSFAKMEAINQRGELLAVGTHVMRWAKKLSDAANSQVAN
ncbi:MaoC/PaaZ C-terminal domain-containing protein [Fulvimarina sp. 2208YS6-2-32]|uniref:MaoC/PaaZ C-terminal domain-containing protein n=1 Tax=Fulvimarina uroteuthidis TaxID=3098149 RepID=A0ABU5I049_9HYPH|nr:MaoC/PaaZ C-terminal domain-containing protein [Fulvimarina sp. 2208YS6-2-32]MDY8108727.1 MaoC/PaaZ C-terminal domain-containing protein [Fulvimarina sp. 2208YS6-2-32]